jgi:hypothetical protein
MGTLWQVFGHCDPWDTDGSTGTITVMTSPDPLLDPVSALVDAADEFHRAAAIRGSHRAAPDALASLREGLQLLSAAWYRLAADAVPGASRLSREQEVRLIGALHDVAAAFARCARACREGGATVAPVIARELDDSGSWFASRRPATERGTVLK